MSRRDAVLEGVKEAKKLHDALNLHAPDRALAGRIDVFNAAREKNALVMFRPLKGLLGAFLREGDAAGIIVTTQRRLPTQRFTGAHELAHFVMGHKPSLDREETLNAKTVGLPIQEIEANAFASEFLAPRWLLAQHAVRQGWNAADMADAQCVYQLSLRIGLSYDATCRSLSSHKIVKPGDIERLLAVQPKEIKQAILPAGCAPASWHSDVWLLTDSDHGGDLEGHPEDLFVVRLRERSGAGYLWNREQLGKEGFTVLSEARHSLSRDQAVGSDCLYEVATGPPPSEIGMLGLKQIRPWMASEPLSKLEVAYDVRGREVGLSRAERMHSLAA